MTDTRDANGTPEPLLSEERLRAVRDRDPQAMEQFFGVYYDRVFGYLLRLVDRRSLAEDLTQEVFLRLHRALDRLDPKRDPAPWVFTVASNLLRDYWRSSEHHRRDKVTDVDFLRETAGDGKEDRLEGLAREESEACLRRMLERLAENDRQLVMLRSYAGLDSGALATALDISREAVRQRFSRALKKLGELYRKFCEPEGRSR